MEKTKEQHIKLGIFIVSAFLLIVLSVYFIGMQSNLFEKNFKSYAIFTNVKGLKIGNAVRFNGINIGTVSKIQIIDDSSVRVDFIIEEKVREFIKVDALATITSEGLIGNVIVNIIPGTASMPFIPDNHEFQVVQQAEVQDIINELKSTSEYATQMMKHVSSITDKIDRGEGIFGKLFSDTSLYNDMNRIAHNVNTITGNLALLTIDIRKGNGIIGKMINDTVLTANIINASEEIEKSSKHINEIMEKMNAGSTLVGKMLTDTSMIANLYNIIVNARNISDDISLYTRSLKEDSGIINRLATDKGLADSIQTTIQNLNQSAIKIGEASETIENSWLFRSGQKRKNKKQ